MENHEFRRWGEGVRDGRFSSDVVRAEFDRVSAGDFTGSAACLPSTARVGEELVAGLGVAGSGAELESDLGRAVAFLATLSRDLIPN